MALIEWSDAYRTGNPDVDEQHEHLFELLNRLHQHILAGRGKDAVGETLDDLTKYVVVHFRDEEALMRGAAYPGLEGHREIHLKLVDRVVEFGRSQTAAKPMTPLELVRFLSAWIEQHILHEDLKFARWLQKT